MVQAQCKGLRSRSLGSLKGRNPMEHQKEAPTKKKEPPKTIKKGCRYTCVADLLWHSAAKVDVQMKTVVSIDFASYLKICFLGSQKASPKPWHTLWPRDVSEVGLTSVLAQNSQLQAFASKDFTRTKSSSWGFCPAAWELAGLVNSVLHKAK